MLCRYPRPHVPTYALTIKKKINHFFPLQASHSGLFVSSILNRLSLNCSCFHTFFARSDLFTSFRYIRYLDIFFLTRFHIFYFTIRSVASSICHHQKLRSSSHGRRRVISVFNHRLSIKVEHHHQHHGSRRSGSTVQIGRASRTVR